jgi:acetylornithine deacetylase
MLPIGQKMQLHVLITGLLLAATPISAQSQRPLRPSPATGAPSYRPSLLALHRSLVEIPSITGNEEAIGTWLASYLESHGWGTALFDVEDGKSQSSETHGDATTVWKSDTRSNVLAFAPDLGEHHPRLVVTSHIDVVPPNIKYAIDEGKVGRKTVIKGRGSVDAKASIAAQIIALHELLAAEEIRRRDVLLVFVVGEEVDGKGMRKFSEDLEYYRPDVKFEAVIFGEPTEGKLACGHKGHVSCRIHAKGKAGHSGYPWLGKSANEVMVRALGKIVAEDLGSSKEFGNTTVNIGTLEGGVAGNVISESAEAHLTIRVAEGPQSTGSEKVRKRIAELLKEVDDEALSMDCDNGYGAVQCDCDVDGFETITVNYGTDVPNLKGDHAKYLYGPGSILVAHSDHEAITVGDLEDSVEGYKKLIKHVLKK